MFLWKDVWDSILNPNICLPYILFVTLCLKKKKRLFNLIFPFNVIFPPITFQSFFWQAKQWHTLTQLILSSSHFSMLAVLHCWYQSRTPYSTTGPVSVTCLFLPCFHSLLSYLSVKAHRSLPAKAELSSGSSQHLCSWRQGLDFPRWKWRDVWVTSPPRWSQSHYHGHGHSANLLIT